MNVKIHSTIALSILVFALIAEIATTFENVYAQGDNGNTGEATDGTTGGDTGEVTDGTNGGTTDGTTGGDTGGTTDEDE